MKMEEIERWVANAVAYRERHEKWQAMTHEERERLSFFSGPPMGEIGLSQQCVYPLIEAMWALIQRAQPASPAPAPAPASPAQDGCP